MAAVPAIGQALLFAAGAARYALPLAALEQVLPRLPLRTLPEAPAGVIGLLPWRGSLLPVADLGLLTGGAACSERLGTRLIVLRPQGEPARRIVLLAERVFDVLAIQRLRPAEGVRRARFLADFIDADGQPQLIRPEGLLDTVLHDLEMHE